MVRAKGKAQELVISAQVPLVGMKRGIELEEFEDQHEKPNKRVCGNLPCVVTSLVIYRRWLQRSTAGSNDGFKLEL